MSTYLQLLQKLAVECGVTGSPTAVTGQNLEFIRMAGWIVDSYEEIQTMLGGRWRFLRKKFTFDTVAATNEYAFGSITDVDTATFITRFSSWRLSDPYNPPKRFLTSGGVNGQTWLIWTEFDWWESIYSIGTQNDSIPLHITISPQDTILLGPTPDGINTITGEYWRSPQILVADGDIPEMPAQFHRLIVYLSMMKYANFESAQEVAVQAHTYGDSMLRQLFVNQGETFADSETLA